jgi:2-amino-4-hydroxy-6-hydroxymethyldihydropteridine diphosphokinase
MPVNTFLSLGSNLGQSRDYLRQAVELIGSSETGQIAGLSQVYRTKAWGKTDQPDFLNMAIELRTSLRPEMLMQQLLEIEKKMGRERKEKWGERIIDIDILLYENEVVNTDNLIIPHPEMHNRKFVLVPLMELHPQAVHPVLQKNISQLLALCTDDSAVIAAGNLFD